jgi:type IV pilus assembly protein PilE
MISRFQRKTPAQPPRQRGMTLIELAIVIVVVAIIVAIAVPSYRLHVLRSQREDARAALLRIQAAQEKFLIQHGRYTADLVSPPAAGGLGLQTTSEHALYSLDVALTATGYVARATAAATGAQSKDPHCAVFSLNEAGTRKALDTSGADRTAECWR